MRQSDLWIHASSRLCPVCGKYGKGPLTYKCGRVVYRHMEKRPGKVGKAPRICEIEPAKAVMKGVQR